MIQKKYRKKLSLTAIKKNEKEILEQIEIDFVCIILAIDTRIEREVMQKETKCMIKDLENSAKILPLTKTLDILLSKAES